MVITRIENDPLLFQKISKCNLPNRQYNRKNSHRNILKKVKRAIFHMKKIGDRKLPKRLKIGIENLKRVIKKEKDCDFEDLLIREYYIRPTNSVDQYSVKKKRRKTEQEKLIDSLNENELNHVDGAFKRSSNMQYKNLNEDKLLNKLFDSQVKRKSGAVIKCDDSRTITVGHVSSDTTEIQKQEVKKKRKTEKEKLIESLSEIEKIHVDGAFKRNVVNSSNNFTNNNSLSDVFSNVQFDGRNKDIESLIKDEMVARVT